MRLTRLAALCVTLMLALASSQANELTSQIGNFNVDNLPQLNAQGLTINNIPINTSSYALTASTLTGDAYATVQAAINACQAKVVNFSGGCTVIVPPGAYSLSQGLSISSPEVSIVCDRNYGGWHLRQSQANTFPNYVCQFTYSGAASPTPFYLLTIAPSGADTRQLVGSSANGILWNCASRAGCGGVLLQAVSRTKFSIAVYEPSPAIYPTNNATSAGQSVLHFASAAGVVEGQIATHANILSGTYVISVSGGDVTISSQALAGGVLSGDNIGFGGEGLRLDTNETSIPNNTDLDDFEFYGRNLAGAAGYTAPLVVWNGSSQSPPTGVFGNVDGTRWSRLVCVTNNGDCLTMNNSDHNTVDLLSNQNIGAGAGNCLTANGSSDVHNGGARYAWFAQVVCGQPIVLRGTESGGWTNPSTGFRFLWDATGNGTPIPTIGTGVLAYVATDKKMACHIVGTTPAGQTSDTCSYYFMGTTSGASATRLTEDLATAGLTNCANQPINSDAAFDIMLTIYDRTTPTVRNTFSWHEPHALFWEGNTAATAVLTSGGSPTAISNGTLTTITVSETADTTNGCLNLSFTPPGGNTDTLDAYATVTVTRTK